jgi:hypothetical protein
MSTVGNIFETDGYNKVLLYKIKTERVEVLNNSWILLTTDDTSFRNST